MHFLKLMAPSHYLNQHWFRFYGIVFTWRQFVMKFSKISILKKCMKFSHSRFPPQLPAANARSHWGLERHMMPHWTGSISSDLGHDLSPVQCEAITWNNAEQLSVSSLGTNFCEIWSICFKRSSAKCHFVLSSMRYTSLFYSLFSFNPLWPSDAIWQHKSGQHWLR